MRDCAGKRSIIVGDGRLTLTGAPDGRYGFIIMDVFTSDAIPMHLLTLEALTMYGRKLKPDGLIAFNISNRYLNLLPVIRTLSEELGWTGRYRLSIVKNDPLEISSIWVVLAKQQESLKLEQLPEWKALPPEAGNQYRWTDDYSNLLSVLRFRDGLAFAQ
jgi:spermidine synthase